MREKGIDVIDIPPRIRKHNYTETSKKSLKKKKNEKTARNDNG